MFTRTRVLLILALCTLVVLPQMSWANPLPATACCFGGGACQLTGEDLCYLLGGLPQPGVWSCEPNPCAAGVCCTEMGTCIITDFVNCVAPMGIWFGDDTTCDADPCHTGACCLPDGSCVVLHATECAGQGGTYTYDFYPCSMAPCVTSGADAGSPMSLARCSAVPNPFTAETTVSIAWRQGSAIPADVEGTILDAAGRVVRSLTFSASGTDRSLAAWDGRDNAGQPVPAGVYFLRALSSGGRRTPRCYVCAERGSAAAPESRSRSA